MLSERKCAYHAARLKKGKPVPAALSRGVPACARVLVFALFQKDRVEGIAASGLKG